MTRPSRNTYIQTNIDWAPKIPGESNNATEARLYAADTLWGVFEMEGSSSQYVEQKVKTEAIDWDNNKLSASWWKARCPDLADVNVLSIANPSGQYSWPNFLTEGSCADWMNVKWASETFTCDATIQTSNAAGIAQHKVVKARFTATTTNASTRTYRKLVAFDSGETPPEGLAAAMWAEWLQLHHDGEIALTAQEAPVGAGPGMTLNITGGRPEWAAMAAMITEVGEDYALGTLTVRFGVPGWIDLDSRMAWIRNCRTRRFGWRRELQGGGAQGDAAQGGEAFPAVKAGGEATAWFRQRFIDPAAQVKHEADLNVADISGEDKRTLKFREVKVLAVSGGGTLKARSAYVLCSEPFGDEEEIGGGLVDIRYDKASKQIQKQTEPDGAWVMISGGQSVEETLPGPTP